MQRLIGGPLSRVLRRLFPAGDLREILLAAELSLIDASIRTSRSRLETLLDRSFTEVGASGRSYSREATLAALAGEAGSPMGTIDEFRIIWRHHTTAALVAYRFTTAVSDEKSRTSHRVSFWVRSGSSWRIVYHQGTPAV